MTSYLLGQSGFTDQFFPAQSLCLHLPRKHPRGNEPKRILRAGERWLDFIPVIVPRDLLSWKTKSSEPTSHCNPRIRLIHMENTSSQRVASVRPFAGTSSRTVGSLEIHFATWKLPPFRRSVKPTTFFGGAFPSEGSLQNIDHR